MKYPIAYTAISNEEMTYLCGGSDTDFRGLFDYLMGDYLRDTVKGDLRNAVWNSAKKGSFAPMVSWYQTVSDYSLLGTIGYVYGMYHLWEYINDKFI